MIEWILDLKCKGDEKPPLLFKTECCIEQNINSGRVVNCPFL